MIAAATLALVIAVLLGVTLVLIGLRQKRGSLLLALSHLLFAVLGLGLLIAHVSSAPTVRLFNLAALLLVLALLGGLVLLMLRAVRREYRTPPPLFVVVMHAALGIAALLLLLVGMNGD